MKIHERLAELGVTVLEVMSTDEEFLVLLPEDTAMGIEALESLLFYDHVSAVDYDRPPWWKGQHSYADDRVMVVMGSANGEYDPEEIAAILEQTDRSLAILV